MRRSKVHKWCVLLTLLLWVPVAFAAEPGEELSSLAASMGINIPEHSQSPSDDLGQGPFKRLVITNVFLVDGLGSPRQGPVHLVIEGDRLTEISSFPVPEVGS